MAEVMGLQGVGAKQKGPAVRQLDMRHLQLGAFAAQNRKVLTPVELEGIAGIKMQRHKGSAPRRLLFTLAVGLPNRRENDPPDRFLARLIRTKAATRAYEPVKPSVTRSACNCFAVRFCLRDFPASVFSQPANLSAKGSILLCRSGVANFGSMVFAARCLVTVLRDTPVSRAISRIDSFCRKCIRRMMFNSPMWITPLPPPLTASGKGSHGSVLSENYAPYRLSSG